MSFKNPFKQNPREFSNSFERNGSYQHQENYNKFSKKTSKYREKLTKEKEWGKVKFNPVAAAINNNKCLYEGDAATPWSTFKNELLQKQQDVKRSADALDMDTVEAKEFLQKREKNYRRLMINETKKRPVKWEKFLDVDEADDEVKAPTTAKKRNKLETADVQQLENVKKQKSMDEVTISKEKHKQHDQQQKQIYSAPIITKEKFENFDSKKLTFTQNNHFRKIITKTTMLMKNRNLKTVVLDLKRRGVKRKF